MSYSETRSFCPVSRATFNDIRENLAKAGVHLPDVETGSVDAGHGFQVHWDWRDALAPNEPWLAITLLSGNSNFSDMAWEKIEAQIKPFVGK